MERVNFKIEVSEEVIKERKILIQKLHQHPLVKKFCMENPGADELVEQYPYRFKKWIEGISQCQKCSGLDQCRQENRGQVMDLRLDGYLDFVLRNCRYARQKKEEEAHLSNLAVNDMPPMFYKVRLEKLELDADNAAIIDEISRWLLNPQEIGFYLQGSVGIGKSTLAAAAVNHFARKGIRCAYVNVPSWVARMKGYFNDPEEYERQIRILSKVDFAVFDDIGAESVTAWVRDELLFPILNTRMEQKRMTWFTSNEDWDSLYDHYRFSAKFGEEEMKALRIMERIKALSKQVNLSGKNRRRNA